MTKIVVKFRDRDYDDEEQTEYRQKKKVRKKEKRKAKYFDEFDSYEAHHKYDYKSQKYRY